MSDGTTGINKVDVFGVGISVVSPARAVEVIIAAAQQHLSWGVSARAVHGLIETRCRAWAQNILLILTIK